MLYRTYLKGTRIDCGIKLIQTTSRIEDGEFQKKKNSDNKTHKLFITIKKRC